jgi:hypothetical protein
MLPELTVELAGQVGAWRPRHVRTQARTVWAAWLRAPQLGTIGVYVLAKPSAPLALAETMPNHAWVRVQGMLAPLRVAALPSDARAADDVMSAPLLVHAIQITRARRRDPAPPILQNVSTLQVRAPLRIAAGELAPAAHSPDLYHLSRGAPSVARVRIWSCVRGVLAAAGAHRYVRYVVAEAVP